MEIQQARPEDVRYVREIAEAAYTPYIRRIGKRPAPMDADFAGQIMAGDVFVLSEIADIAGYVVLREGAAIPGSLHVENVAVHPEAHGQGYGRALIAFAEAEAGRRGLAMLDLYTNAAMTENLALYPRLGWEETGRRTEAGFERVYFVKRLVG